MRIVKHPTENKYLPRAPTTWETESYSFSMGGIKPGRRCPPQAAQRELHEETGYDDIQSAAELAGPHIRASSTTSSSRSTAGHMSPVCLCNRTRFTSPLSPEKKGMHELIWLDPGEAVNQSARGRLPANVCRSD